MSENDKKISDILNGSRQTQQLPAKQIQLRRISRAVMTRMFTEQLTPLYPLLNKTQVRAALVLTNNDLHECRLILDMKCKFEELKNSFKKSTLRRKTPADSESSDSSSSLDAGTKGLQIINKKRREDVEICGGMRSIEANETKCEDVEKSEVISSSLSSTSFSSMRSSSSSDEAATNSKSVTAPPMKNLKKHSQTENTSGRVNQTNFEFAGE